MIARVIVDVPAKQTDRLFDYLIPESLLDVIQPGMRVVVPFGPRKIQGFVIQVVSSTNIEKLKSIEAPMDLYPVLTSELLELGDWLAEHTLCYKISAFQVMLPAALKAKYVKMIRRIAPLSELPEEVQPLFHQEDVIHLGDVPIQLIPKLTRLCAHGQLEVLYEVKERATRKIRKYILPAVSIETLEIEAKNLSNQAAKQKDVIRHFLADFSPIALTQLMGELGLSSAAIKALIKKGMLREDDVEVYRDPYENRTFQQTKPFALTEEQQQAITPILTSIEDKRHQTFLLYGVTGSGKTEVYLQSIQRVLEHGKEAIVLVPEISLTPQMVKRFKERFGNQVAVLHSGLSNGEKYDEWRKIQRKEVKVAVGARSAVFAPFENLGIIIIDEEHETSYKQEEMPRYHARDVAIKRGHYHSCPVVLGSATPHLETYARAGKGVYQKLTLSKRMNQGPMPSVDIIDMREELREGNRSMFSRVLLEKLKDRLEKQEQTVLFLNKRGHSSFVMCRDCGYVVNCPDCDISLTYHSKNQRMKCHYCGHESYVPKACPECSSEHIRYFGTGTQKVEEELGKVLPEARVIRMDVDTTSKKGAHEKLLTSFGEGKADILLGTQMIAKGLDFPNITLVGVLSADTMLHLPDFRSSEKTFQLLTQVSGRAGRHEKLGEVVVQTYTPEHYSIELAALQDYDKFYLREMQMRKLHHYPPFYYLALVTVSHEDLLKAVSVTEKITAFLRSRLSDEAVVLGPVASPIPRIKNRYRYQCLIKYKREPNLGNSMKTILDQYQAESQTSGLAISTDVNPYILM